MADRPVTVSEITQAVKQKLEREFPMLWVIGEISQYREHSSGHRYFTLKDEGAQLSCVMWRSTRPSGFEPSVGAQVLARGRVTVYERSGQYQLTVQQLFPSGLGQQQLALEELKQKLLEEGLFDESLKRPLPQFPLAIGIVTSRTGAAIRDILNVLGRRFAGVRAVLRPAQVQGEGAPQDIADGIADLNALGGLDVLIVGRGGGSAEDLAAFNSETVVRAVRASQVPIISAVGHEIDISLADLAADVRAPTPSAAAELAVRDSSELRDRVNGLARRAYGAVDRLIDENMDLLVGYRDSYGLRRVEDRILQDTQRIDDHHKDLMTALRSGFDGCVTAYRGGTARLAALSPLSVLARSYSVTQTQPDGTLVQDARSLSPGDRLRIRLSRGEVTTTVDEVHADKGIAPAD